MYSLSHTSIFDDPDQEEEVPPDLFFHQE